jgi:flagellar motor protein MotB
MAAQSREPQHPVDSPDSRLAEALGPSVGAALKRSVRDEPRIWAEAVLPILAPAIRMAVTSALRDLVQTLNQLLENSLSVHRWRWRVEAWRTGKPLAEVVLLRTLIYRVERVLLVDRNSGLLLASASASGVSAEDEDLVSGMLIAIQEFIRDSFHLAQNEGVREIQAGDFSLWVEAGQRAVLAAVVRGNAPVELREVLRAAVDLIHEELGAEIRNFQGDSKLFEQRCRPILQGCLQSRSQVSEPGSYWRVWLCAAILGAALGVWGGLRVWQQRRWNRALAALQSTPGIAITQSTKSLGKPILEGLRDPFSLSAESVLANNGIAPGEVSLRFQPFISLDPGVLARRARATIEAPDTISVSLDHDVVRLGGTASHAWIISARHDEDRELNALRSEIEGMRVLFDIGSSTFAPRQALLLDDLIAKLKQWMAGALAIGRVSSVDVIGHTDRSGSDVTNAGLSDQRAHRVAEILLASGIPADSVTLTGAGPYPGPDGTAHGGANALQRNVVFRLYLGPGAAGGARH